MRIVIGADRAGFPLKEDLAAHIRELGHQVLDVAAHGTEAVDCPDCAEAVGKTLLAGQADRGVLICRSGVSASAAANTLPGIRAGLCHDAHSARQRVEHDNMNVLVLGGRVIGPALARELITAYLAATFTAEERHKPRLQKVAAIEGRHHAYPQQTGKRHEPRATARGRYQAILFDMDGVITDTASIHAACWKTMFDEYLQKRAKQKAEPFRPFEVATDYKIHVDGKPRYLGVRDFLKSRGICLPEGTPEDPPTAETVCGLGNRKDELVNERFATGVEAYPGSVAFLRYVRRAGVKTAVVTSSQNCQTVLHAARIDDLFDARVDGVIISAQGLAGKPAPDSFLKAAEMLGVPRESAVVVEDAISGVQAGARGGFGLVIGVDRKDNAEELKANGAHVVVNDLADLLTWDFGQPLKPAA
jgi:beta-phosphoglucomutase family hydrolase/RpiB/LacA/LacB family sugar-phosphate isomerase